MRAGRQSPARDASRHRPPRVADIPRPASPLPADRCRLPPTAYCLPPAAYRLLSAVNMLYSRTSSRQPVVLAGAGESIPVSGGGATVITALFIALAALTLGFVVVWVMEVRKATDTPDPGAPDAERIAVGFFANFFDALGIGSFATSTAYFRLRKLVRDELIPGSLNVGYCLPTITQAFIGIAVIAVEPAHARPDDRHRRCGGLGGRQRRLAAAAARDPDRHGHRAARRRRIPVRQGDAPHAGRRGEGRAAGHRDAIGGVGRRAGGGAAVGGHVARAGVRGPPVVPGQGPWHRARGLRRNRQGRGHRPRRVGREAGARPRRELPPGPDHAARHRLLRAVHGARRPARHDTERGVPDHDGRVRVPHARGECGVRAQEEIQPSHDDRNGDRRRLRLGAGAAGGEVAAAVLRDVARHRGHHLHGHLAARSAARESRTAGSR